MTKHVQHLGTIDLGNTKVNVGLACPPVKARPDKPGAIFAGYTERELAAAFDSVKPAGNWKNPIDIILTLTEEQREAVSAAVAFYTGSETMFTDRDDGKVRVRAAGYYLTIGS